MDREKMEHIQRLIDIRIGIESRRRGKNRLEGAINWADLRCVDVEYVQPLDGRPFYRAIVEEASPSASALQDALQDQLLRNGLLAEAEVCLQW
jgi:hypothetical protein